MKTTSTILFLGALFCFCSCENFDWFRSESTMNKQIDGTWRREFLTTTTQEELWTFKEGKIEVLRHDLAPYDVTCNGDTLVFPYYCDDGYLDVNRFDGDDTLVFDNGAYTVDAKVTVSYLKTTGLSAGGVENNYNYKWTIVQIDNNILQLVADRTGGDGNIQREFAKKK